MGLFLHVMIRATAECSPWCVLNQAVVGEIWRRR